MSCLCKHVPANFGLRISHCEHASFEYPTADIGMYFDEKCLLHSVNSGNHTGLSLDDPK